MRYPRLSPTAERTIRPRGSLLDVGWNAPYCKAHSRSGTCGFVPRCDKGFDHAATRPQEKLLTQFGHQRQGFESWLDEMEVAVSTTTQPKADCLSDRPATQAQAMSGERVFPGECSRAVPGPFVTVPPQPATAKPGQLTQEQLRQYFDVGYVKVENFFTPAELDPVKAEIEELVEDLTQRLLKAGKIKNLYREYGFYQRLTMINKEFPGANVVLHKLPKLPKSFRSVWASPRLLNIVEQLLGTSDIMGHPVYNLRTKTPHNEEVTVPWHQDNGYISNDGYFNHVVTAWIPLLDADRTNGCMQLARGGHRSGRVAKHTCCAGGTWYVMLDEQEMVNTLGVDLERDLVVEPVNYGSLLLFSNMLPHRSLDNTSNDIRWSLDLRWNRGQDPTGFFGVKDGIRMRSSENPDDYAITEEAWAAFDGVSRHTECGVVSDEYKKNMKASEFDTTIPGPWMNKWEIVHMNRHVAALANADKLDIPPVMG